ncbi:unnamed protein product [Vicia faba]|uniref:Uncharacterized protein n=1 Tax=Vicia faba TaxID=3906 RepID=A0AAV1ADJ5_VICFA|nr:unnamed protein product [Vicia faba]
MQSLVGTRQGTNTYGKDKKSTKNCKKPAEEPKLLINMHRVKMKGVVLRGKACGLAEGLPTIKPAKEVKRKKLRKTCDISSKVPLSMSDPTGKGKDNMKNFLKPMTFLKFNLKFHIKLPRMLFNSTLIQMIVSADIQGNTFKSKPFKKIVVNVVNNVSEISIRKSLLNFISIFSMFFLSIN